MRKSKIFTLLLISLFLFTACNKKAPVSTLDKIRQEDEIIIGVKNDSKPFGFLENGELAGYDIDVARAVSKKILDTDEPNIVFKPLAPSEKIFALNSGSVDMVIAVMSITPSRLEIVDFSQPYYVAGLAIMTKKDTKIHSIADLNNKDVAIILGTTGESTIRVLAPNAKIMGARTYPESIDLLKNGTVDAILADDSLLLGFMIDDKQFKIIPKRYSQEFYAIAIRKNDKKLQTALDSIITQMSENGELTKIRHKWIYN